MEKQLVVVEGGQEERVVKYLQRVRFPCPDKVLPPASLGTLQQLHECQVRHVPFENLDQHSAGRHIVLRPDVLYDKIVLRGRGGFCFELNGLYAEMLRSLGFREVHLFPARVWVRETGNWTRLKSHVITVVRLKVLLLLSRAAGRMDHDLPFRKVEAEQVWVSDVGYGSCPHAPLRLDLLGVEQKGDREWAAFRWTRVKGQTSYDDPDQECLMMERQSKQDGQWHKCILAYEQSSTLEDLSPYCDALQAEEASHLTQRILISAICEKERRTMSGAHRFITTTFADGRRVERNIFLGDDGQRITSDNTQEASGERMGTMTEKEVYLDVLKREFGLYLTPDEGHALDLEKSKRNAHVW